MEFSIVCKEALDEIVDYLGRMDTDESKKYLSATNADSDFNPNLIVDIEDVRSGVDVPPYWGTLKITHSSALAIYNANSFEDLKPFEKNQHARKDRDDDYSKLIGGHNCNGRLVIKQYTLVECCCERFAREHAYGNFDWHIYCIGSPDGSIGDCPDVLPFPYYTFEDSVHSCPFCGAVPSIDNKSPFRD